MKNEKIKHEEERAKETKEYEEKISLLLHQLRGIEYKGILLSLLIHMRCYILFYNCAF